MLQGYTHNYALQVNGQIYRISTFTLTLTYGQIQQLSVTLPIGQTLNRAYDRSPFLLYKSIQSQLALQPIQATLYDYNNSYQGQRQIFTGIVAGMHLSVSAGGSMCLVCQCLGMAAKLMYNPLSDYIMVPKGCQNPVNLQKSGLGLQPQLRQPWSCIHGNMISLYNSMQNKQGQTLQKMFQAAQVQLQKVIQRQLTGQNIGDYKSGPAISDFIKSQYKLGPMTKASSGQAKGGEPVTNSFIFGLCTIFMNQISSGGTIYQCLKDTLGDDVFLQLVPGSDGKYMHIVPTYQYKYNAAEGTSLSAYDIVSIRPSVIASQFIKTPGTVYANFTATSDYGKKNIKKEVINYGKYCFMQSGSFKMLAGPSWCLDMIQKRRQPNSTYTGQQDMDNVAKLMFFQRYGRGSTCILQLAPTPTTQQLRSCIGKAVCIKPDGIKINAVEKDAQALGKMYGQLKSYSITYIAASGIQSNSSLRIQAVLDRFWSQYSKFSQLFTTQISNQQLYTKV